MDSTIRAMRKIVVTIPQGHFFDSHFVIATLAEEYPDIYKREIEDKNKVFYHHSELSKKIKKFAGSLVIQQEAKSWSKNINNKPSPCALWKKL